MAPVPPPPACLHPIPLQSHTFFHPEKRIENADSLARFESTLAYARITSFLRHLNASVSPLAVSTYQQQEQQTQGGSTTSTSTDTFVKPKLSPEHFYTETSHVKVSPQVQSIITLLEELESLIPLCPPETGPRRFGNAAFRTWHALALERLPALLDTHLPSSITSLPDPTSPSSSSSPTKTSNPNSPEPCSAKTELSAYLIGSFGSPQRLDFGTGHELSFLAFLCGIYLLNGFQPTLDEQAIVLHILPKYLQLIRTLVTTYTLEPAGSHGVWGLDDHFFLPYIFGSAQFTTKAPQPGVEPEYRGTGIPRPGDVVKINKIEEWRDRNMYFGAVGFVVDVKSGPFWEHSPILFDISGVREGWGKINGGMIKMYLAEVLGKFPVVQHFHFGSLFPWAPAKPGGALPPTSATTSSSPTTNTTTTTTHPSSHNQAQPAVTTRAPWAQPPQSATPTSTSTSASAMSQMQATRAPWGASQNLNPRGGPPPPPPPPPGGEGLLDQGSAATKAPWAR